MTHKGACRGPVSHMSSAAADTGAECSSALHRAAASGDTEELRRALAAAPAAELAATDSQGRTPLHVAAAAGDADAVRALIAANPAAAKACASALDSHGQTPLHAAAFGGHTFIVRLLQSMEAPIKTPDNDCECCSGIPAAAPQGRGSAVRRTVSSTA